VLSASVLLFELSLTRIFAVMLWSNLAFMVVSTALFGFGLSGLILALKPDLTSGPRMLGKVASYSLAAGASMFVAYLVVSYVPFTWHFRKHPENYLYILVWEIALLLPFTLAGLAIASLLSSFPRQSAKLYGIDLVGAALGSFSIVALLPLAGGEGTLAYACLLSAAAAYFLSEAFQPILRYSSLVVFVLGLFLAPKTHELFPIQFHEHKRHFRENLKKEPVLATRWSTLSRVDIAEDSNDTGPLKGRESRAIWIDGGTNESIMLKEDRPIDQLEPQNWLNVAAAGVLKEGTAPRVLVIGAAGGRETLFALTHGASHVDALEMDPSTVHFVNEPENASFMGHVYQNPRVNLVLDEGRSFLRRQPKESYDIIQSVNNYTPIAMAAGALNLSETFLITTEAFHDYLEHLKPDGILAFHRGATLRVALTAIQAMREMGIEHPEKHIIIANGDYEANQLFLLKKSEWGEPEIDKLHEFLLTQRHFGELTFLWVPSEKHRKDIFYNNVITASPEGQRSYYQSLGLNLTPTTDDRPFIEHFLRYGEVAVPPGAPPEFVRRNQEKTSGIIPKGDFPYVVILSESAVLALLFVGIPLFMWARGSFQEKGFWGFTGFFAALGFSFIVVEICLMKRFVLFLGHPALSITTILVALLCGAGIGSLLVDTLSVENLRRKASIAMLSLVGLLLIETWGSPFVFAQFLSLTLYGRIAVATSMLLPLGVLMGMPFSLGLRLIAEHHHDPVVRRELIAWAWGMNGYTTVIGSALTIFVALAFGFQVALLTAVTGYLLGLLSLRAATA